jgi:hypothetical protein
MEIDTKANFCTIKCMEKESTFVKMELFMKEFGKREESKVKLNKFLHPVRLKSHSGCLIKKLNNLVEDRALLSTKLKKNLKFLLVE